MFRSFLTGVHVGPAQAGCGAYEASIPMWGHNTLVLAPTLVRTHLNLQARSHRRRLHDVHRPDQTHRPDVLVGIETLFRFDLADLAVGRTSIVVAVTAHRLLPENKLGQYVAAMVAARPEADIIFTHGVPAASVAQWVQTDPDRWEPVRDQLVDELPDRFGAADVRRFMRDGLVHAPQPALAVS